MECTIVHELVHIQVSPLDARDENVREDDVVGVGLEARERFFGAGDAVGFPTCAREHGLDEFVNGWVVIHDQEPVRLRGWHLEAFDKDT